ncbi:MAG: prepilin-type N-terminal cleavage/methylation domain-containing protein [Betaproteobacteria bacterium]|nr:prepilin-type N-terminal cleavage/methylation domain-containing protein [Betaproteobacteria bacterium]
MRNATGFTLIELMIVVAIISILAAVALPQYNQYVTRSKLTEATSQLADLRTKMEGYYLDNRRYSSTTGGGTCGVVPAAADSKYFDIACASSTLKTGVGDQTYTITATGKSSAGMTGFVLTIDHSNTKATTSVASGWTLPATNCWVQRKNGSC